MNTLRALNLGIRFLLELCALAALGYWGFQLAQPLAIRIMAGIGAPLAAAVVWGVFVAPKATRRLVDPGRFLVELLVFGSAAAALWVASRPWLGAALLGVYLVNRLLVVVWGQTAH